MVCPCSTTAGCTDTCSAIQCLDLAAFVVDKRIYVVQLHLCAHCNIQAGNLHVRRRVLLLPLPQQVFKAAHAVVFVDCTGWLNLAAHMTRGSLAHAQLAARTTLQLLTHPADPDEAFASAFLTPASPSSAFDYHWAVAVAPPAALQQQLRQEAEGAGRKGKKGKGATSAVAEDAEDGGSGAGGSGASAFSICKDRVLWR